MATITNAGTGSFTPDCSNKTKNLVLGDYLDAKIANYMGISISSINDFTTVRVDSPYANSEGVIKSMESEKGFVRGLRIDLQKEQDGYATFQVQWGTGNGAKGGAYAGVLMRVNTNFTMNDLRTALAASFNYIPVKYARLDP
ncbi:hypothetical protein SAMN05661096_00093 [Marivirga sericea]|uniref:Uncharacterized protein n=1 Tax=Marivirga sericea TaxID=1028 RepID=A0A1X7I0T1_9BACT|nr:hypothetical protein [Marivirga sericea]SMG07927.1 hypothetical protein SAMN05661096_00093 [Marivirga sericea]